MSGVDDFGIKDFLKELKQAQGYAAMLVKLVEIEIPTHVAIAESYMKRGRTALRYSTPDFKLAGHEFHAASNEFEKALKGGWLRNNLAWNQGKIAKNMSASFKAAMAALSAFSECGDRAGEAMAANQAVHAFRRYASAAIADAQMLATFPDGMGGYSTNERDIEKARKKLKKQAEQAVAGLERYGFQVRGPMLES
ncbi:hypothetical protein [Streptomyces sp. WG-D5]